MESKGQQARFKHEEIHPLKRMEHRTTRGTHIRKLVTAHK